MPVAAEINGKLYAIHTDQLNTPRQLTDAQGHKVWQWAISGFGEVEPTTAETGWIRPRNGSAGQRNGTLPITFNLRFAGQQFDEETGLHYNHHRYYDPYLTVGYTEADPLGLSAGWNRFVYAENDPLGFVDADGRHPVVIGAFGAGVIIMTYGFFEFHDCAHECSMCTNHPLKDEPDYQCIPPRDDGRTGSFYSCLFFSAWTQRLRRHPFQGLKNEGYRILHDGAFFAGFSFVLVFVLGIFEFFWIVPCSLCGCGGISSVCGRFSFV